MRKTEKAIKRLEIIERLYYQHKTESLYISYCEAVEAVEDLLYNR